MRKLLMFRNGQLNPESESVRDAIHKGKLELEDEERQVEETKKQEVAVRRVTVKEKKSNQKLELQTPINKKMNSMQQKSNRRRVSPRLSNTLTLN